VLDIDGARRTVVDRVLLKGGGARDARLVLADLERGGRRARGEDDCLVVAERAQTIKGEQNVERDVCAEEGNSCGGKYEMSKTRIQWAWMARQATRGSPRTLALVELALHELVLAEVLIGKIKLDLLLDAAEKFAVALRGHGRCVGVRVVCESSLRHSGQPGAARPPHEKSRRRSRHLFRLMTRNRRRRRRPAAGDFRHQSCRLTRCRSREENVGHANLQVALRHAGTGRTNNQARLQRGARINEGRYQSICRH
jgi:hypothetical protein